MEKESIMIVTVYNSENCGSYWQAYALQDYLKSQGFNVCFFSRKSKETSHDKKAMVNKVIKRLIKLRFKDVKLAYLQWHNFEKAISTFSISPKCENVDCVVLGSDTIWNFDDEYFRKEARLFLGQMFQCNIVISYAASIGNTSSDIFCNTQFVKESINALKYISVRDSQTMKACKMVTSKDVMKVCDPTFLIDKEKYRDLITNKVVGYKYILIYYFGELGENEILSLLKYAKDKKLKIVSFMTNRKWCDVIIPNSPYDFIRYFDNAEIVVTNTFHGCAFSLIFEKNFLVHSEGKNKVNELLGEYNCEHLLYDENNFMTKLSDNKLDYKEIKYQMSQRQLESKEFLTKALSIKKVPEEKRNEK